MSEKAEVREIPRPDLPAAFGHTVANGQLLDRLPIGICCCDRDGALLWFNQSAANLGADPHRRRYA